MGDIYVNSPLFKHFNQIEDPRDNRGKEQALKEIIFITICAITCGAETKKSIHRKRLTAGWNNKYLEKMVVPRI